MKKYLTIIGFVFFYGIIALTGCNSNERLTGKVTFTDGNPAPHGMVIFSTPTFQARGEIQPDGSYTMGTLSERDGLPAGEYKVSVSGIDKPGTGPGMGNYVNICDEKYLNSESSGLTCKVPAPGNKYDIILEPHPKNYP